MIRLARSSDIPSILAITKACAKHMISNGIFQWNENYPSTEAFEKDVKRDELYVLTQTDLPIACIVISTYMDKEYESINWLNPNGLNIYIHRLAVHPNFQKQGFARKLMAFAEQLARSKGFKSVRLDTFSQNIRNQRFYEQRGYKRLGDIYFPKQSDHPFHCYELIL